MKKHYISFKDRRHLGLCSICIILCVVLPITQAKTHQTAVPSSIARSSSFAPPTQTSSIYELLIIAPREFLPVLQPLICHKQRMGIPTRLVILDEIYHQMYWHGRDQAEKIKYYIKTAIEEWGIKYVLLVGDFRHIPVRYCYNADVNHGFHEPCFISELYYADIYDAAGNFSSWDSNHNGVYGEWFGDTAEDQPIDLYPDVAVGRLACRNSIEVTVMVHKIKTYETTTYNQSWFNTIVVVAGDTYPESLNPNWTGNEGEENTLLVLENMSGFTPVKLWTSDGTFSGSRDVIRSINQGCGFLYFEGHANPYYWSTHPPNDADTWIDGLSVLSMSLLRNRNMMPICIVGGCHNLQFDVHLKKLRDDPWYYYTWISECWGWKLTRKIGGGSIATIGCTGLGMSKEDKESFSGAGDYLQPTFFYEYNHSTTHILGDIWATTIANYLDHYPINWNTPAAWDFAIDAKTVQQWALLGDPSLRIGGYPQ
ncbi:MAG: C25 family cysteine peptidase [Candidatus Thermoplasmatota archaeon]